MIDTNSCKHIAQPKVVKLIENDGKHNQQIFQVAKCGQCDTVLSVFPFYDFDQKFQTIYRDLKNINDKLADIINASK